MEQKSSYERLKEYEAKGCHMLIPSAISVSDIAPGFALIVEPVLLRSHPREKDVYAHEAAQYDYRADDWKSDHKTGNELVRIHKQGFDRLAQAAKVDWLPAQVVRDPNVAGRMMASVEGMIRTSTGELYRVQDIAGMDLDIEREKLEAQYKKADQKWLIDRDFLQKKANQAKLCISGAKNRVIKQLLCLRNTYAVNEILKEFVAVRIVPRLDTSDEYTRRRLVDVKIAAMAGIYGLIPNAQSQQQQIEMVAPVSAESCTIDDPNVIDAETTNGNGKTYQLDKEMDMGASQRIDFENSDVAGQCKTLAAMATAKGYDLPGWTSKSKRSLGELPAGKRLELYGYLCTLPVPAKKEDTEDVPFSMAG